MARLTRLLPGGRHCFAVEWVLRRNRRDPALSHARFDCPWSYSVDSRPSSLRPHRTWRIASARQRFEVPAQKTRKAPDIHFRPCFTQGSLSDGAPVVAVKAVHALMPRKTSRGVDGLSVVVAFAGPIGTVPLTTQLAAPLSQLSPFAAMSSQTTVVRLVAVSASFKYIEGVASLKITNYIRRAGVVLVKIAENIVHLLMYSTLPPERRRSRRVAGFVSYAKARTRSTEGGRPVRSRNRRLNSRSSDSAAG